MTKVRTRRLWLQIKFSKGLDRKTVIRALITSIQRGDYIYPETWRVALGWSNKVNGDLKWGEFTAEMNASAQSSTGFDRAVLAYLDSQL